ncbi:MAG: WD40/YVTN/BNR-like repeat-containing protein [Gemmatimonadota bacterium]
MRQVDHPSRAASWAVAAAALLSWACAPGATTTQAQQPASSSSSDGAVTVYDEALFDALEWENIGPARGGRSIAAAGSTARPMEYYFGATGGGLWKTTDGGQNWEPVTDGQIESSSVGAVQVCEADPDVVYLGMGEVQLRGNIMQGDGVYRSTDAGETWTHLGLEDTHAVSRVRIHPNDCDLAYVAALGHPFGPNPERGVYRTTDGGETWENILFVSDSAGAVDLSMDPNDPDVLYAGFWHVYRKPWKLHSGGPGSGLWKTTDGGETWTELSDNPGLPERPIGKVGVSVSPANPDRVYAIIEADDGGVFRSDDGGATWEHTNDDRSLRQRAFYYTRIFADPQDEDRVYALNTGFYRSDDAGETFDTRISVPHGDNHDLWIAPDDNRRMINSNDGGANVSFNGGESWTEQDFPTAQFYNVFTTDHFPYHVCGAQQDNSTACVPTDGWGHLSARGPNHGYYYAVAGGESGYLAFLPDDPDISFGGSYGGFLNMYNHRNGQSRSINVWPVNPMGHSAEDIRERFQWTYPIVLSPAEPDVLYVGSQHVWKSTNRGQSWERISPDLTRADPSTLGPSGGPITRDQTSIEYYATVFTIAPSPHDADLIWAGSDDGLIHVTRDGGESWTDVTPPDLPEFTRVSLIEASPHDPATAYVAAHRHRMDDRAPYVYRTHDYGQTWTKITDGIADGHYAWAIREDIVRPEMLYAGTEHGVYVSWDDGERWQPLNLNLPDVQVSGIVVEDNDLVIGTHGRSFWVLENIGVLRQLSPQVAEADAHLFEPADVYRRIDSGADIYYHMAEPAEEVTLEFLDASGEVIDTASAVREDEEDEEEEDEDEGGAPWWGGGGGADPSVEAGTHRVTWGLRYPGFRTFPDMIMWAAGSQGPLAPPGTYRVRLSVDGDEVATRSFDALLDPRAEGVTLADLEEQFDFAIRIRDRVTDANEAVLLSRGIKQQIDERVEQADGDAAVSEAGEAFADALTAVEGEIYQIRNESGQDPLNFPIKLNNKIAALLGVVMSADARPTDQSYDAFDHLSGLLQEQLDALDAVIDERMPGFNALLDERGLAPIERRMLETDEEEDAVADDDGYYEEREW